jgi:peptidoglycan/xylan/chitin deacetylase (PgdA/CDA1 family)
MVLVVIAAALAISGLIHDQAGRTGTLSEPSHPAPPDVTSLGPVIDARMTSGDGSEPKPGVVALTFDDGPDPTWTPRILEILERHDVPATFFVVGARITQHPGLLRRTVESGHEIGVHTFTHADLGVVSPRQAEIELSQTQLAIAAVTGHRTALMRPPFSSTPEGLDQRDHAALTDVVQDGYIAVLSTHDSQDWSRPGADAIVERSLPSDGEGAIVLLHDGGGDRQQTVTAVEELIPRLKAEGYEFATVTDAVGRPDAIMEAPAEQRWRGTFVVGAVRASGIMISVLSWALVALGVLTAARMLVLLVAAGIHVRSRRRATWGREVLEPVTVIVPAFNEAAGIVRTVGSVYDSEYPYLEIIVVDDGSTDGTAHAVEQLGLPGVRVISQPNRGQGGGDPGRDRRGAGRPDHPPRR